MGKLKDTKLRAIKATDRDYYLSDGDGLAARVLKTSGIIHWMFRYRFHGSPRLLRLGTYPEMSLARARIAAAEQRELLSRGEDPIRLKKEVSARERTASTVDQLIEDYYARQIRPSYKRPDQALWLLQHYIGDTIGKLRIKDVSRADVSCVLNQLIDKGTRVTANRVLNATKKLFGYAEEQGHITENPAEKITRRSVGGQESSKDRALTLDEVRAVLIGLDSPLMFSSWQAKCVLKMIVYTLQRPGEIAGLQWSELNGNVWRIPRSRTKNDKTQIVHLNLPAVRLLNEIREINLPGDLVFPTGTGEKSITVRAISETVIRHLKRGVFRIGDDAIEKFTPHDLRRTVATRLADLGVAPYVIEKILNHAMEGVLAVYNKAEYLEERRAALEMWGTKVEQLTSPPLSVEPNLLAPQQPRKKPAKPSA